MVKGLVFERGFLKRLCLWQRVTFYLQHLLLNHKSSLLKTYQFFTGLFFLPLLKMLFMNSPFILFLSKRKINKPVCMHICWFLDILTNTVCKLIPSSQLPPNCVECLKTWQSMLPTHFLQFQEMFKWLTPSFQ